MHKTHPGDSLDFALAARPVQRTHSQWRRNQLATMRSEHQQWLQPSGRLQAQPNTPLSQIVVALALANKADEAFVRRFSATISVMRLLMLSFLVAATAW